MAIGGHTLGRRVLELIALAVVYAGLAWAGLHLHAVNGYATMVWPPAALALAVLVRHGRALWPGVALGVLVLNLISAAPLPWPVSLGIAAGNTLEAYLGAWALDRFLGLRGAPERFGQFVGYVLLAALGSTLVSATLGVLALKLGGRLDGVAFAQVWLPWWLGDACADLILAPALLAWSAGPAAPPRPWPGARRVLEGGLLAVGLMALPLVAFEAAPRGPASLAQPALVLPLLMWAALRFGLRGATAGTVLTAAVSIWSTARGHGPFARDLFHLQVFTGVCSLSAIGLAVTVLERDRAAEAAQISALRLAEEQRKQRQLEQQLLHAQKMESIGRLAGGVAHDFNNLLTAILGAAHVVDLDPSLSPDVRACNREIMMAGERAAELTRSLLTLSRRQVAEPAPVELNGVVQAFTRLMERLLGGAIRLELHIHPAPLPLLADRTMLEQVLLNLASNAADAMPDGGTLVVETGEVELQPAELASRQLERPGRYAVLAVSDDGAGMDEATRQRIFEPFFTTKGEGQGTGLGLSIVYGVVRQHGGGVQVYSEPGQGTTFRVYLPLSAAPAAAAAPEPSAAAALRGSETVLVVDDDPGVRRTVQRILGGQGYEVLEAGDVDQALAVLAARGASVRLVLADIILPGGGGWRLREALGSAGREVPLLSMSGYPAEVLRRKELLADVDELVPKPLHPRVLLEQVRARLDAARAPVAAPA